MRFVLLFIATALTMFAEAPRSPAVQSQAGATSAQPGQVLELTADEQLPIITKSRDAILAASTLDNLTEKYRQAMEQRADYQDAKFALDEARRGARDSITRVEKAHGCQEPQCTLVEYEDATTHDKRLRLEWRAQSTTQAPTATPQSDQSAKAPK